MHARFRSSLIRNMIRIASKTVYSTPCLSRGLKNKAAGIKFDFSESSFETHNCPKPPSSTVATKEELLSLYKVMVEIRRLEMACDQVRKEPVIKTILGLQRKADSWVLPSLNWSRSCCCWNGSCYSKK